MNDDLLYFPPHCLPFVLCEIHLPNHNIFAFLFALHESFSGVSLLLNQELSAPL